MVTLNSNAFTEVGWSINRRPGSRFSRISLQIPLAAAPIAFYMPYDARLLDKR